MKIRCGLVAIPAFCGLLTLVVSAQAESPHPHHGLDPIIGIWKADVQRRDCASGTVLASFKGITSYQHGGTLVDVGVVPPTSRTVSLGHWERVGQGEYTAKFIFARFLADGNLDGYTEGTRSITLSEDGELKGVTHVVLKNAQGDVVGNACATDRSVRFD